MDNLAGCTHSVLDHFKNTVLASEYSNMYLYYLRTKYKSSSFSQVDWSIERTNKGCTVSASSSLWTGRTTYQYNGDIFFINLSEKRIYPETEGAKLFMDYYGGSFALP